jgi:SAM-dependent methyltransferase
MHQGNREWLLHAERLYGGRWKRILEIGSLDINGSARELLHGDVHIGVDLVAGPGVDIVCYAERTTFERESFDCLLCTSVLEHAPNWRGVLSNNLKWLKRGGKLLLSWGAEGNKHHAPEPWAPVPVGDVIEHIIVHVEILEAYWERTRFTGDCAGCYNVIARRR